MSPLVMVRQGSREDVPMLVALAKSIAESPGWTEAMYEGYMGVAGNALCPKTIFVAQSNGTPCGFAAATVVAGQAELESIAVAESMRRAGVGRALLTAVLGWAREHGANSLELEVRAGDRRAQAFYAANGFRVEGHRARYYKDPDDDALLMTLDLDRH